MATSQARAVASIARCYDLKVEGAFRRGGAALAVWRGERYVAGMATQLNLGADIEAKVDALVAQGRFASREDVVREGLRLIEERDAELQALLDSAVEAAREADEVGWLDADEVFDRLERRYADWPRAAE